MTSQDTSSEDTTQTDGEGPEGSDKPPHNNTLSVPLPPPDSLTYEKQPGHTRATLNNLVLSSNPQSPNAAATTAAPQTHLDRNTNGSHVKPPSMISTVAKTSSASSSSSSPTASDYDWSSQPSTRPNSRAPSRAPSMSGGASGSKLQMSALNGISRANSSSQATESTAVNSVSTARPKPASVHSTDGDKHKFTLKDLLAAGPKLNRKSSQRSNASKSSRKSDGESADERYTSKSGPKSTAGDSVTSLSQKYGVCQKVAIGKGATSVVRLAHKWDRSEERLYAVKEFRKRRKNESEKEYVKKLTAEFCISSTLHHTNIVETVDLVQDESQHWCEVMEFCPGGDLYAAIKKGGMSPSEVECCFKQILRGVEYLHSQGVAHRDIKPENLFFDTKGHLKIGDYGASTVYRLPWESTIHMSTGLCGSEPYIAPEQFLGKPYDARLVDIWACGIVYYCLHFSELPWRAAQQSDGLYAAYASACASSQPATSQCPLTISNLSPRACRGLIRKMLEPDPKLRASIEDVIKHAWIQEIEVCHEVDKPRHVHVHARQLAQAQMKDLGHH
ncbi:hypothetical protein D9758_012863 [Tetrapyrgos nigripes]|uniref:non-specific serine/threonine protein kinase n=1 Tax=Tetrapyrgos nigripes TaxID=182062 RepID=A0A8H5CAG2_9AGAR|nr:hypothetical protein D9758_012863 [Tetrapyrgos nigripes]